MKLPAGTDLGKVELQGVIGGEGDHETTRQVLRKWVAMVAEEEAVVAEWRHGNANLGQVVQILQDGSLGMTGEEERTRPVICGSLVGILSFGGAQASQRVGWRYPGWGWPSLGHQGKGLGGDGEQ